MSVDSDLGLLFKTLFKTIKQTTTKEAHEQEEEKKHLTLLEDRVASCNHKHPLLTFCDERYFVISCK